MQCQLGTFCVLLLALWLSGCRASQFKSSRLDRWVKTGFQYLKANLCHKVSSLPESECKRLSLLQQSGVAVYVSPPGSHKVVAVLPDSLQAGRPGADAKGQRDAAPPSSAHDAVLVLDPSPGEPFGHPVVLFYVDFNVTSKKCERRGGIYLGDECLTLELKSRCQNQLKRPRDKGRGRRGTTVLRSATTERNVGLCEIHFLPLVVEVSDSNRTQRMHCVEHPEFARCPRPLPVTSPTLPLSRCELKKNTRRCHQQRLAMHLSCRLYQTCDHAVLLSGGWQQQITYQRHVNNLQTFYSMLRNNGFHKDYIKTFFAGNGLVPDEASEGAYPATEKAVIRNHISNVCRNQHCADSLVIYLNSPTRNDGTMLLWDSNYNGIADSQECYTVSELLSDIAGCRARRVLLFVEQSYSAALGKSLKGSLKHLNVVLLSGTPETAEFWGSLHPTHCLIDHLNRAPTMSRPSAPQVGLLNVTLAGAPCNATPPLTEAEMRREYMGCQNMPTALWHQSRRQPEERRK